MDSPRHIAWKKFKRNPTALFGLCYFVLCLFVTVFAYPLSPDSSPNANRQILELAKKAPGSQAWILNVPQSAIEEPGFFSSLLFGKPPAYRPIAIADTASLRFDGASLAYKAYSGGEFRMAIEDFGEQLVEQGRQSFIENKVERLYFFLGTDGFGRDLWSRILQGTRVSLIIGLLAVSLSLLIGIFLGTLAGYFGGWPDRLIMWLISVMWSLPTLLLALLISFLLGKGFWQVCIAIGISMWVEVARIVRGQILSIRERQFSEAARALGFQDFRIMFRHVLPNVISPIIVVAVANFGSAVLIESGLSFLGIGVEVPVPSWGSMIAEGYTYIVFSTGKWLAFFPGMALILLVVSINLIGIGLRDALDVNI
ncbi:MAG: ABC transporter permease [Bacteroidota bacterium]